jgi:hypothetical protein
MAGLAAPAVASRTAEVIVLPGASSAEGIAAGGGATFFAGDLFRGDIFLGNVRRGTAELFIDAPEGRMATGMKVDVAHHLLFVAGGFTGQAYVYDTRTGATVATYQFAAPGPATAPPTTVINDVTITGRGAWFTDSVQAKLYFVPVSHSGVPGRFRTLALSGPAADTSGDFNLNGIAATPNGQRQVRHGHPAHRQAVRGGSRSRLTVSHASRALEGIQASGGPTGFSPYAVASWAW